MTNLPLKTMRDVFIEELHSKMHADKNIFFLSADFGSPKLDALRKEFPERFINVGIAEQNLINLACGLALEGFSVYAYAIAPFLCMRPFEQIRINLSLQSQLKELNVNLLGVGAGLSYDVSGPTHHCLEDISLMRTLPNISVISPSDWVLSRHFVEYSLKEKCPKYFRFDGKPLPAIYKDTANLNLKQGFAEIEKGKKICLVATGYMTHQALRVKQAFLRNEIGIIDIFLLKPVNEKALLRALKSYKAILTLEEGFIGKAGLDSLISQILRQADSRIKLKCLGFSDKYVFDIGDREYLHRKNGLDLEAIVRTIKNISEVL